MNKRVYTHVLHRLLLLLGTPTRSSRLSVRVCHAKIIHSPLGRPQVTVND